MARQRHKKKSPGLKYRDGLFRDYFNDRTRLLSLCNALLHEDATNPDEVEINTLDGIFFSRAKNDLSCLFRGRFLVLVEHMSTRSENLPIRILFYVTDILRKLLEPVKTKIYREGLIRLPMPAFFVLYNGDANEEDVRTLRLSDAFGGIGPMEPPVTLININAGKNDDLLRKR